MNKETISTRSSIVKKNFTFSEDPYVFDIDKNGFPALTAKNVNLINFIIKHDSNYRPLDDGSKVSISDYIKKYGFTTKKDEIVDIIKYIDRLNSTHQASEGPGGGNQGREKTANCILSIIDFYKRLEKGDATLVDFIAENAIPGRYTFSFASKYCTYMSRALFEDRQEEDNYSIYDKIICNILPYYAWVYLGKSFIKRKASTIQNIFAQKHKGDYGAYRKLIDEIRSCAKNDLNSEYVISRKDFDHLLWYYFKGNNPEVSEAIKCVGDDKSRLI